MRITPEDILRGPLKSTLYRMTLPMIIGIFVMMAFGAVDTFFIGLMGSEELAAISFTMPVTMIIFNLVIGLSIGASVLVGSAIGKEGMANAARKSTDSLLFSMILVSIVSVAGYFTIDPLFTALGASELTLPYIHDYMDIWYLTIVLMILPMVGNSVIRATGDTKWPSILMMGSGLINALLDPLLIFGIGPFPELGIRGAAIATAISWLAGFGGAFWLLYVREKLILLSLPRLVGLHPDDNEPIHANFGRYGPYIKHGKTYVNLKEDGVFDIGMNRAVALIAEKIANPGRGRGAAAKPVKELGKHPDDDEVIGVFEGRYGPYVKWNKVNATLPKEITIEAVTLEQAIELVNAKAGAKGKKKKAPAKKKTAAKKKTTAKKKTPAKKKPAEDA